jgi:NTE family protein
MQGSEKMTRALVLGGGGPVGIAWESGLIDGLAEGGVDVGRADFIMGTSAGAFVGARLAMGHDPRGFFAPFAETGASNQTRPRAAAPAGPAPDLSGLMKLMAEAQSAQTDRAAALKALGRYALDAQTMSEDDFVASFGAFLRDLPEDVWPSRDFACTAVDAETGAFEFWTKASKVGLKRAVASSCSVPGIYPPVTINARRYMDGGMRSATNADLATGHDRVLVVAVTATAAGAAAERSRAALEAELDTLRTRGAVVELLAPDGASAAAFGANLMDFRRRPGAAAAGRRQGLAAAPTLAAFWS